MPSHKTLHTALSDLDTDSKSHLGSGLCKIAIFLPEKGVSQGTELYKDTWTFRSSKHLSPVSQEHSLRFDKMKWWCKAYFQQKKYFRPVLTILISSRGSLTKDQVDTTSTCTKLNCTKTLFSLNLSLKLLCKLGTVMSWTTIISLKPELQHALHYWLA